MRYCVGVSDKKAYQQLWNIVIPKNAVEEFKTRTKPHWQGEGTKYTVFKLESETEDFISLFLNEHEYERKIEKPQFEKEMNSLLLEEIPNEFRPKWEDEYSFKCMHKGSAVLYLSYFADLSRLIFCQEIT